MNASTTINLSPAEQAEFNKRVSVPGLSLEAFVTTMYRQFLQAPPEIVAYLTEQRVGKADVWAFLAAQILTKAKQELTTEVGFNLSPTERKEFSQRTANHPLTPQAVSQALFQQFLNAPPEVVAFVANQRGSGGDLWAHLETATRGKVRQELGTDLDLAKAVRAVMASKATS